MEFKDIIIAAVGTAVITALSLIGCVMLFSDSPLSSFPMFASAILLSALIRMWTGGGTGMNGQCR